MQISERGRQFGKRARTTALAAGVLLTSGVATAIGGGGIILPKILANESTQVETYTGQTSSVLVDSGGKIVAQEGPNKQVLTVRKESEQNRINTLGTAGIIFTSIVGTTTALSGLRKVVPDKK